jgi:hypothetical protein
MRRCAGLTNGFSKKVESHCVALVPFYVHCNFVHTSHDGWRDRSPVQH